MADDELEVQISKLSEGKFLLGQQEQDELDELRAIEAELATNPTHRRVTSARPNKAAASAPGSPAKAGLPGLAGGDPATATPTAPGAPAPRVPRPDPRLGKAKEDDPATEVQPSGEGDQVFEVLNGQANAKVSDRLETRFAFLYYSNSNYKPNEMHRMQFNVPYLKAEQLLIMCTDLELMEPKGPLSKMSLGIMYTTQKGDNDPGLSYAVFLDVLLELAFETGRNVAGQLVTTHKAREQQQLLSAQMGATMSRSKPTETQMMRQSMRMSQTGILRGFSESGFKNTARSDQGPSVAGPPMLLHNTSLRSRFSDCGKLDGMGGMLPDGTLRSGSCGRSPSGRLLEGEFDPNMPGADVRPHMPTTGRSRAVTREARKLRPSMSGAVRNGDWPGIPLDGAADARSSSDGSARSADAHPLHAAALRAGASVSPPGTMRPPSATRATRFSRCGGDVPDFGLLAPSGGALNSPTLASPTTAGPRDDLDTSSPLTCSTDTSATSPVSVMPPQPRPPGSRPGSGLRSPQASIQVPVPPAKPKVVPGPALMAAPSAVSA